MFILVKHIKALTELCKGTCINTYIFKVTYPTFSAFYTNKSFFLGSLIHDINVHIKRILFPSIYCKSLIYTQKPFLKTSLLILNHTREESLNNKRNITTNGELSLMEQFCYSQYRCHSIHTGNIHIFTV